MRAWPVARWDWVWHTDRNTGPIGIHEATSWVFMEFSGIAWNIGGFNASMTAKDPVPAKAAGRTITIRDNASVPVKAG